jgi:hypothetical protein
MGRKRAGQRVSEFLIVAGQSLNLRCCPSVALSIIGYKKPQSAGVACLRDRRHLACGAPTVSSRALKALLMLKPDFRINILPEHTDHEEYNKHVRASQPRS